jgi:hypothetical protein
MKKRPNLTFKHNLEGGRHGWLRLTPGAEVHYVVGNSTFYGVLIPVERLYEEIMQEVGFTDVDIEIVRKRNSKKELYEFAVSATCP